MNVRIPSIRLFIIPLTTLYNAVSVRSHSVMCKKSFPSETLEVERVEQTQVAHMTAWQLLHVVWSMSQFSTWAFLYSTRYGAVSNVLCTYTCTHKQAHTNTHRQIHAHAHTFTHTYSSCSTSLTLIWEDFKRHLTSVPSTMWVTTQPLHLLVLTIHSSRALCRWWHTYVVVSDAWCQLYHSYQCGH